MLTSSLEGYDLALLGNLYASPVFNEKYGHWNPKTEKYQVSPAWQSGLSNGARAGEIIGLIIAGWITDRYGSRITTLGFLVMMIGTIFVLFFAPNIQVLIAGEVLCGQSCRIRVEDHADDRRYSMGCVPECGSPVRFGSSSSHIETVSHDFHQHVLGHRAILRCCCDSWLRRLSG
jgi:MFS family permease